MLIDDSYNANPGSLNAAIETLAAAPGERWLVLGDMRELGVDAERLHAEVGALAKRSGIAACSRSGQLSRAAVGAFGGGAAHFDDQAQLIEALRAELRPWCRACWSRVRAGARWTRSSTRCSAATDSQRRRAPCCLNWPTC